MTTPTQPTHLYVHDRGYIAVIGWSVEFLPEPSPACPVFTHENMSNLRRDDFHVNLLRVVRDRYRDRSVQWLPAKRA